MSLKLRSFGRNCQAARNATMTRAGRRYRSTASTEPLDVRPTAARSTGRSAAVPVPWVSYTSAMRRTSFERSQYAELRVDELGIMFYGSVPRTAQRHVDDIHDRARSWAQHHDPIAQEYGFRDTVRHEKDCGPGLLPDFEQLLIHLVARDLIQRAERL